MTKQYINGVLVDLTTAEQLEYDNMQLDWQNKSTERKLAQIKEIRLEKLIETDYLAMSDNVLSDEMKAETLSFHFLN